MGSTIDHVSTTFIYIFSGICIGFPPKWISQTCPQEQESGIVAPYTNDRYNGCFHHKLCAYNH